MGGYHSYWLLRYDKITVIGYCVDCEKVVSLQKIREVGSMFCGCCFGRKFHCIRWFDDFRMLKF